MSRIKSSSIKLGSSFVIGNPVSSSFDDAKGNLINEKSVLEIEEQIKLLNEELELKRNEAIAIINEAKLEADKILVEADKALVDAKNNAEQLVNDIKAQAYDEGFNRGVADGTAHIEEQMRERVSTLETLISYSYDMKSQIIKSAEKDIIDLVILIAHQLTKSKIEIDPSIIENILSQAILELKEREELKVFVNPSIVNDLNIIIENISNNLKGLGTIKLVEDKTVDPDGIIVESPDTRIDARLQVQVAELSKKLLKEFSLNPAIVDVDEVKPKSKSKKKVKDSD